MEMWLKQLTLMLLTAAAAGMVISTPTLVNLDETQREVNVPYGSSLVLHCNLSIAKSEKFRVFWYLNSSGSSFNGSRLFFIKFIDRCNNTYTEKDKEIICNLSNVTKEDSGLYFCKVIAEIPLYQSNNSGGTQVNILKNVLENATCPSKVTSKEVPLSEDHWWMWILVGASTFILIVLLVICTLLRRRCRRSREPDPIYMNSRPMVNKQSSPRPAVPADKLKTAPSQSLRTPSPGGRYEESKRRQRQ